MGKKRNGEAVSAEAELSFADLRELCRHLFGEGGEIEAIGGRLLREIDLGRRFIERARKIRPSLEAGSAVAELEELFLTFDAEELLDQLLKIPDCGVDPKFMIWKQYWGFPPGDDPIYEIMIEIAVERERETPEATTARERICAVRRAIEREWDREKYLEWRSEAKRELESKRKPAPAKARAQSE